MERGRPGVDYTAKTLRGHKGQVCDVVYISSPDPNDIDSQCPSVVTSCGVDGTVKTWAVKEVCKCFINLIDTNPGNVIIVVSLYTENT